MNEDPASTAGAEIQHAHREPDEARRRRIAERAYRRAEERGFAPGQELDDWLAAEADEREGAEKERLRGAPYTAGHCVSGAPLAARLDERASRRRELGTGVVSPPRWRQDRVRPIARQASRPGPSRESGAA